MLPTLVGDTRVHLIAGREYGDRLAARILFGRPDSTAYLNAEDPTAAALAWLSRRPPDPSIFCPLDLLFPNRSLGVSGLIWRID